MMVAEHMIEHRGISHGTIITGSYVYNQRIRRKTMEGHVLISIHYRL